MKYAYSALALGASASAAAIAPRTSGCCFQINVNGATGGPLGQLSDGQNRVGTGFTAATYCLNNGAITDSTGRGCILTAPTTQFQCDSGASPTAGFSITSSGEIEYNGSSTFYECAAASGVYNIYTTEGGTNCSKITLTTAEGKCAASSSSSMASATTVTATVAGPTEIDTKTVAGPTEYSTVVGPTETVAGPTEVDTKTVAGPTETATEVEMKTVAGPTEIETKIVAGPTQMETKTVAGPTVSETCVPQTTTETKMETSTETKTDMSTVTMTAAPLTETSTKTETVTVTAVSASTSTLTSTATTFSTVSAPAKASSTASSAPKASSSTCPANLSGNYQYPHLIVPISSATPNTAAGTSYNGEVSSTVSSIFNFDVPASYSGNTCTLVFLLPEMSQLETSSYTTSGSGGIEVTQLVSPATASTTYDNAPKAEKDLGTFEITPGSSTVIATGACAAGETLSYELSASGDYALTYFQDYNPSPIGLYITEC